MNHADCILIDGSSYLYRAFHALPPLTTSKGQPTGAVKGVVNMLRSLRKQYPHSAMVVVFDPKGDTFRNTLYADYKANRQETPEDILAAVPDIKRMLEAFNIPIIEVPGYEADDIIGTLSVKGAEAGYEVFMVTSDKDYGQLVNDHVFIYKPASGFSKAEVLGVKEVCA
ncbi:MAG TPA: DNA polymerase I, partial [Pseudomonadales bacterium]|nr:DNA polymerase I [Pseudomonadales bacterium]